MLKVRLFKKYIIISYAGKPYKLMPGTMNDIFLVSASPYDVFEVLCIISRVCVMIRHNIIYDMR